VTTTTIPGLGSRGRLIVFAAMKRILLNADEIKHHVALFGKNNGKSVPLELFAIPGTEGLAALATLSEEAFGTVAEELGLTEHDKETLSEIRQRLGSQSDPDSPATVLARAYPDTVHLEQDLEDEVFERNNTLKEAGQPVGFPVRFASDITDRAKIEEMLKQLDSLEDTERVLEKLEALVQRENRPPTEKLMTLFLRAKLLAKKGEKDEERSLLESGIRDMEDALERGEQVGSGIIDHLANRLEELYVWEPAKRCHELGIEQARSNGNRAEEAKHLAAFAKLSFEHPPENAPRDFETTLATLQKCLEICRTMDDKTLVGRILEYLGEIEYSRGDYTAARQYSEESLAISRAIGDRAGEGATLNNIAAIYRARGDYATALTRYEESLAISRAIGDRAGLIPILHNMASIAYNSQDWEKTLSYWSEAWQLAMETRNAEGIFHVGRDLGQILIAAGQKEDGVQLLTTARDVGRAAGFPGVDALDAALGQMSDDA